MYLDRTTRSTRLHSHSTVTSRSDSPRTKPSPTPPMCNEEREATHTRGSPCIRSPSTRETHTVTSNRRDAAHTSRRSIVRPVAPAFPSTHDVCLPLLPDVSSSRPAPPAFIMRSARGTPACAAGSRTAAAHGLQRLTSCSGSHGLLSSSFGSRTAVEELHHLVVSDAPLEDCREQRLGLQLPAELRREQPGTRASSVACTRKKHARRGAWRERGGRAADARRASPAGPRGRDTGRGEGRRRDSRTPA